MQLFTEWCSLHHLPSKKMQPLPSRHKLHTVAVQKYAKFLGLHGIGMMLEKVASFLIKVIPLIV